MSAVSPRGSFEPYPYRMIERRDHRRFGIEQGLLDTPQGPSPYTICHMRPFACVVPIIGAGTPEAKLVLVRQFRYAVGAWQLESPAGGIEEGEDPVHAAMRELREESGFLVDELRDLGWVYPSGGSTSERAYLFCASCSRRGEADLDRGEQIECVEVSRCEMEELLLKGNDLFAHAVTYAAWYKMCVTGIVDDWMPLV